MNLKNYFQTTQFPIMLIYFFLGFAAILVQSILIREFLVIAFGNELVIGSIFAFWFLWIAVGAGFGISLLRRMKDIYFLFWIILFLGLFLFPFQITAIRYAKVIFSVPIGGYMSFFQVMICSCIFLSPFSFMIGITFPLGAHLFQNRFTRRVKIIGSIYIFEAMGSLVGGLLFTFFLITSCNPFQVSYLLILFAALIFLISESNAFYARRINRLIFIVLIFGASLTICADFLQNWSEKQRWLSIVGDQNKLVSSLDTPYDHVSISRLNNQYSVFQNGHLAFSFPNSYSAKINTNLILLQHPNPGQMLAIGSGFCDLAVYMVKFEELQIDWIVKDRNLYKQLQPLLPLQLQTHFNLKTIFGDGRSLLQQQYDVYDIIYLSVPPPSTASLNRFYSFEFFRSTKKSLKKNGVLILRLPISDNYLSDEILQFSASIFNTLKKVFNEVEITSGEQNFIVASNQPGIICTNFEQLHTRWNQRGELTSAFSPYSLLSFYDSERQSFLTEKISNFQNPALNSDLRPISYLYNLVLWNIFSGNDQIFKIIWNGLHNLKIVHFIFLVIIFFLCRIGWILLRKVNQKTILEWNSLFGVFIAGLTAIGLEIILLFGFQNLFGSLYQNIALLTALFMLGLASGSWILNSRLHLIKHVKYVFIYLEIIAIVVAVSFPFVFQLFGQNVLGNISREFSQLFYLVIVIVVGMITGAIFPLAGKGMTDAGKKIGKTASLVDAADHTGAFVGAFFTGTFLIPIFGFSGIGWIIALLNFTAILFWLTNPVRIFWKTR